MNVRRVGDLGPDERRALFSSVDCHEPVAGRLSLVSAVWTLNHGQNLTDGIKKVAYTSVVSGSYSVAICEPHSSDSGMTERISALR